MGLLEDIRWWHWIVISLIVGAALGYINQLSNDLPANYRSIDRPTFENYLLRDPIVDPKSGAKFPWIRQITVYPPSTERGQTTQVVIFLALERPDEYTQVARYETYAFLTPVPFESTPDTSAPDVVRYPGMQIYIGKEGDTIDSLVHTYYKVHNNDEVRFAARAIIQGNPTFRNARSKRDFGIIPGTAYFLPWDPAEKHTIEDFLKVAVQYGYSVNYRTAWWHSSQYSMEIWMGGSFFLIGLVWPALVHMMVFGGFGRRDKLEKKLKKRYEKRYGSWGSEPTPVAAKPGLTADDMAQLANLEKKLVASIQADRDSLPQASATAAAAPATVKQLTGGELDDRSAEARQEEEKQYKGEYYPVARPVTHKEPEKKS